MRLQTLKRLLVGRPIPLRFARRERLAKVTGLAVFASDALSSVAYATEEILLVLALAGSAALSLSVPIALGIVALIGVVVGSYRQTILAYPQGGGAYVVSKENLGTYPGLVAGGALLIDYVLTVAVSVAAGVAAVTSAVPALYDHRVALGVLAIAVVAWANLRGVRESGQIFAVPTYLFIGSMLLLLGAGFARALAGPLPVTPAPEAPAVLQGATIFLVLRAFAAGCTALTGIEAVSDGVPAFRPPEAENARATLAWLGAILATLFSGVTILARLYGVAPREGETVVSQIARQVFGDGPLYYLVQAATMMILILAANTSFADFPRLAFFLARDRFLPRQLANRGDRLVFSNGVVILALAAAGLILLFGGDTHALIPLYAVGVFISFTISQASMVRRGLSRPGAADWRIWVSGVGAVTTGVVATVIAATKFTQGAWIVLVLIPFLIAVFLTIHRHYAEVAAQLSMEDAESPPPLDHTVLVLVGDLHKGVLPALQYAKAISPDASAVYVEADPEHTARLKERWAKWEIDLPLVVLRSPYRSLLAPLIEYLDEIQGRGGHHLVTIILPEFVPARWWQHLLHNQSALLIKGALLFRKGVIVTNVPYHLTR